MPRIISLVAIALAVTACQADLEPQPRYADITQVIVNGTDKGDLLLRDLPDERPQIGGGGERLPRGASPVNPTPAGHGEHLTSDPC